MPGDWHRTSFTSALVYQNPKAALDWLEKAFGFETVMLITGKEGNLEHSEMRFGDSLVMIGNEWTEKHRSPQSIGGLMTQTVHVHLTEDIDSHCARARAAGAVILVEPENQFYGDRTYRASDPEGHIWTFGQTIHAFDPKEAEKVSGLTIKLKGQM